MNWQSIWNNEAKSHRMVDQVQRKDLDSTCLAAEHIMEVLAIKKEDIVLDVCCGNGLITKEVSKHCSHITGIDISEDLIQHAVARSSMENTSYSISSAEEFSKLITTKVDKIYLEFSFQYFEKKGQGKRVIEEMLKVLKSGGKIFIGNIPDQDKLWTFYNTFKKRLFYYAIKISGKKSMGKFWNKDELLKICQEIGVQGKVLVQNPKFPYAHYRFDFLIEK